MTNRFTEAFATTTGTARSYQQPFSFSVVVNSGTIYLKCSTDDGVNYDTIKSWTASTTEEQVVEPVSGKAKYRFDSSTTGNGSVVIHGNDGTVG